MQCIDYNFLENLQSIHYMFSENMQYIAYNFYSTYAVCTTREYMTFARIRPISFRCLKLRDKTIANQISLLKHRFGWLSDFYYRVADNGFPFFGRKFARTRKVDFMM